MEISAQSTTGKKLQAPKHFAMVQDLADSHFFNRREFLQELFWRWFGVELFTANFADVDGIFTLAGRVTGPKIVLIVWFRRRYVINQRLMGNCLARFGQVKGNLSHQTVMAANDKNRFALGQKLLPRFACYSRNFSPTMGS